jgi:LEA14-like dessication related protein
MEETLHKPNRSWLPVIIVMALLAAIGTAAWYYFFRSPGKDKHVEKLIPHINVANIEITDIDGEHIKFLIKASIANAFPVDLSTKRIQYQVYIDTAMIAESSYVQSLEVRSSDSIAFDIPMEASLKRMIGILKEFKTQHTDSADYKIIAQVYMNLPVAGEQKLEVNIIKRLPVILIPELTLADTDFKKLGFKESGIDMSFNIENPNRFPIRLNNGKLNVKLEENIDLDATVADIKIAANSRQTVPAHFDLKTTKLGSAIWKLVFNKKNTHFNVVFTGMLDTETDILKNTNLVITAGGTVDEALKAIKESK